jgi:3-methyladenine DNA glycosylase AlkD
MSALAAALRKELRAHADADRAAGAQAYMKSAMPYHGLDAKHPELSGLSRREALKNVG